MLKTLLALSLLFLNCSPVFAELDTTDWKKRCLQIEERINYIEKYLRIPEGEKEKINNNSTWFDPVRRVTIEPIQKGGRLDILAGRLGYLWYTEPEGDWADWHKASKECLKENGCLDTNLGR